MNVAQVKKKKSEEILEQISTLTEKQLEILRELIARDSKSSFIKGLLCSIPIGIITSLFAAFILKRYNISKKL